jgi:tRNA nucleotidyltransferase/poly(A) polymerase
VSGTGVLPIRSAAEAWRALRRREELRAAESAAEDLGITARVVGGAVRDAFLRRPRGDLDVSVPRGRGRVFGEALARRLGSKAIEIGAAERRIVRIPWHRREVDVWEEEGDDREADLLRRDFRVNALAFELPGGRFVALPGALEDLRRKRLAPPREGVFLEDPLRVLRAARLELAFGFRVASRAGRELRLAAPRLAGIAAERRLVEIDLILSAAPRDAARGLRRLEGWGALEALLHGTTAAERANGTRLVARAPVSDPALARLLLLLPLGRSRALAELERWRVSRNELRAARTLLALPLARRARAPSRREVVLFLRAAAPFVDEARGWLLAAGDAGARRLARAAAAHAPTPSALRRVLAPKRPLTPTEVASLLGIREGPALGAALAELDVALASREVRGRRAALAFLSGLKSPPAGATLNLSPALREGS